MEDVNVCRYKEELIKRNQGHIGNQKKWDFWKEE